MSEVLDLSGATFTEVKFELGLARHDSEPFYRNSEGDIILFRGEQFNRSKLQVADKGNALYGDGAYLGNSPASVAFYAGNSQGVNAYVLPEIEDEKITQRRLRLLLDVGISELVMFPVPLITRLAIQTVYPESKQEELPKFWALLPTKTAFNKIKDAKKVAWLGRESLGRERR